VTPQARNFWTDTERALLADAYTRGGLPEARKVLPYRHERAIYSQAYKQGLKSPRTQPRLCKKYESTEQIDDLIRRFYLLPETHIGRARRFAESIQRPAWWVKKRAAALGLAVPREKPPEWTEAELALLEANAFRGNQALVKLLKRHGYKRTEAAVGLQLKRRHIERADPNVWTGCALARLMGVDGRTVGRWIDVEGLPAKRRGTARTKSQGGDMWLISRAPLRRWIATHQQLVDLRKVDRYWFMDLAFGGER